jgi:hypothetical protein
MQCEKIALVIGSSSDARRAVGKLNFHSNPLLMHITIMAALSMLAIFLINPIDQIGQIPYKQYVFGQENINVSLS